MRIVSLASGSGGNAYCAGSGGEWLLIDCGIGCRELVRRCRSRGIDPARIAAAVFTHNHSDHIKGLAAFRSKHPGTVLYANMMTADAIAAATGVEDFAVFENGQEFAAGPFRVKAFSVPHDVPDSVGFLVRADGATYFHATDVGTPLDSIGVNLAEADIATLESNHDPGLLAASRRPESLKSRIRGGRGHLSNGAAAGLAAKFASPRLATLALAHLSAECNAPHLALGAVGAAMAAAGKEATRLTVLPQDEAVEIGVAGDRP